MRHAFLIGLLFSPMLYADVDEQVKVLQNQVDYLTSQGLSQKIEALESELQGLRGDIEQLRYQLKQAQTKTAAARPVAVNDQQLYKAAIDALQKKQYPQAAEQLQKLLKEMPQSTYAPNAHYWLGEIDLLYNRHTQAMSHFQYVIDKFPKHNKVPDSLLKLSVAEVETGRYELAQKHLKQIVDDFPRSSAAHMAHMQLSRLKDRQQGAA